MSDYYAIYLGVVIATEDTLKIPEQVVKVLLNYCWEPAGTEDYQPEDLQSLLYDLEPVTVRVRGKEGEVLYLMGEEIATADIEKIQEVQTLFEKFKALPEEEREMDLFEPEIQDVLEQAGIPNQYFLVLVED